eukprot:GHUV01024675.1.p1 GENE.GHUV01024675.1~~GHUV01024675.1.p1  ORF type:complete len:715 (+),score=247.31 GHUV01024675.1:297-2441(+)
MLTTSCCHAVSRSLTGHRSNCLTLEFHPFGPFLSTGSLDTNVKVWDLRRKDAITTFKGHTKGVKKLAISPDGKWVCSGSENGEIKLWDMQSGKVVKDGWSHDNTITGIEFHPAEFILATSSTDKTVKIWDLEVFQLLDTLGPEATAVKAIAYHKDGKQLLTATADALNVWGFEPAVHHDRVPMDWRQLADMHLSYKDDQPRVVGCCTNQSAVGVFLVDLRKVMPFCGTSLPAEQPVSIGAGDSRQKQQQQPSHMQPLPQRSGIGSCGRPRQEQQPPNGYRGASSTDAAASSGGYPGISPVSQTSTASTSEPAAGPLSRQLNRQRTPPGLPSGSSYSAGGMDRPLGAAAKVKQSASAGGESPLTQHLQPGQLSRVDGPPSQQPSGRRKTGEFFPEFEIRVPAGPPPLPTPEERVASRHNSSRNLGADGFSSASSSRRVSGHDPDTASAALRGMSITEQQQQPGFFGTQQQRDAAGSRGGSTNTSLGPSPRDRSPAPPVAAAAPPARSAYSGSAGGFSSYGGSSVGDSSFGGAADSAGSSAASTVDPIAAAMAQRPLLRSELAKMVSGLQIAKGFIARGNLEGAYKAVVSQGDAGVACMVIEALQRRQDAFELNSVEPLIKILEILLGSGVEQQQIIGLSALSLVLRGPGQVVRDVCNGPAPTGVDLSYEQRRNKCLLVKMALEALGMKVGFLARGSGPTATRAQLVAEELKQVVS